MNTTVKKILQFATRSYFRICSFGKPIKKKIVFASFNGKQYSDNPRAISEKFHELFPDWEIVWFLRKKNDKYGIIPDYVKIVSGTTMGRLRMYKELATSFCYVRNVEFDRDNAKRKGQFFVQTWHGDRYFKKILYESEPNKHYTFIDSKVVDIALAGSVFGAESYHIALRYNGNILCCGSPRNDRLINCSEFDKRAIKSRLKIGNERVLLYAPTYKDAQQGEESVLVDLTRISEILSRKGENWIILIRFHLASNGIKSHSSNLIDVSDYPDMTDLLIIADLLLTDYSSCICDYALTGKPCVLVPFDIDDYTKNSRELKVSPYECGLLVAKNQDELENIIEYTQADEYASHDRIMCDFFQTRESGIASDQICQMIYQRYTEVKGENIYESKTNS